MRKPRAVATALAILLAGCGGEEGAAVDGGPVDAEADGALDAFPLVPEPVPNGTCVPHGARFVDYYSCEGVPGPSPSEPPGASAHVDEPDPDRLLDPDTAWVHKELAACACVCCHTGPGIGTYRWSMDFEPFWLDYASADVLRVMLQPAPLGSYPDPDTNHGFSRSQGLPSTDPARLAAYLRREQARRP